MFCVDEKSAIQALDRLDPVLPMSPGHAERLDLENPAKFEGAPDLAFEVISPSERTRDIKRKTEYRDALAAINPVAYSFCCRQGPGSLDRTRAAAYSRDSQCGRRDQIVAREGDEIASRLFSRLERTS